VESTVVSGTKLENRTEGEVTIPPNVRFAEQGGGATLGAVRDAHQMS